ncbi:MAG: bifunctional folylpolyglutamate synthase/dihydrofolate synthase [Chthoniobacterales bacterium]|nr:bifunctional folylpolyglutamate synthase/dihydrofolate synthase [Chthoniobacterales bacterium]
MTFRESLAWLDSTQTFGIKLGLENIRRLLDHLGNPERPLRILHVAGTNGKGSVCAMLDSIFREANLKSGLYTSPHLCDFRERIRVNGNWITTEATAEILSRLHAVTRDWPHAPTFFELSTALALAHFSGEACDVVVLETGMGGTLDATNAVVPVLSILTPIAKDHAEWLGNSLSKIAAEKAGIIKPGIPVVSAPQPPEVETVLRHHAAARGSALTFVREPHDGQIGLQGSHQKWNAALAVAAIRSSGFEITDSAIVEGLRSVDWPARFQKLTERIILDGAHNPHAALALVKTWQETFGPQKAAIIFGAMKDKDCREMLDILTPIATTFHFTPVHNSRSSDPTALAHDTAAPARAHPSLGEALDAALSETPHILITGSLYLAGEALKTLKGSVPSVVMEE